MSQRLAKDHTPSTIMNTQGEIQNVRCRYINKVKLERLLKHLFPLQSDFEIEVSDVPARGSAPV